MPKTCNTNTVFYSYRSKYYRFEEFLSQWLENLKSADKTVMTVKLMKDIDQYKVSDSVTGDQCKVNDSVTDDQYKS